MGKAIWIAGAAVGGILAGYAIQKGKDAARQRLIDEGLLTSVLPDDQKPPAVNELTGTVPDADQDRVEAKEATVTYDPDTGKPDKVPTWSDSQIAAIALSEEWQGIVDNLRAENPNIPSWAFTEIERYLREAIDWSDAYAAIGIERAMTSTTPFHMAEGRIQSIQNYGKLVDAGLQASYDSFCSSSGTIRTSSTAVLAGHLVTLPPASYDGASRTWYVWPDGWSGEPVEAQHDQALLLGGETTTSGSTDYKKAIGYANYSESLTSQIDYYAAKIAGGEASDESMENLYWQGQIDTLERFIAEQEAANIAAVESLKESQAKVDEWRYIHEDWMIASWTYGCSEEVYNANPELYPLPSGDLGLPPEIKALMDAEALQAENAASELIDEINASLDVSEASSATTADALEALAEEVGQESAEYQAVIDNSYETVAAAAEESGGCVSWSSDGGYEASSSSDVSSADYW